MHGWPVGRSLVRGSQAWIDRTGRCYAKAGKSRMLYRVDGDTMRFVGHGARQCKGCGVTVNPDPGTGDRIPVCPLCGAPDA
jgi:hypothetical protein